MTIIICGVDVSAAWLDACVVDPARQETEGPGGPERRVARSAEGVAELAAFCVRHGVGLVVLEATGGYERLPLGLLWAAGLPCALANPRQVRRFAEAMGTLEKTDRIDAGLIARFALARRLSATAPPSPAQARLRALSDRLRQTTQLIVAQTNQRRLVTEPAVLALIDEVVALLRVQLKRIEADLVALISTDPLWQALGTAVQTIKGVATRTLVRLLAEMPELGTLSGKAVAKLAGLAPLAQDSGSAHKPRHIRGGREGVRSILVLVAGVVARHEPDFQATQTSLRAKGKPAMVVRVALARKLLVRLNAKARDARASLATTTPMPA